MISVCIPSYNSEKYIFSTIESVLVQTHQEFELILVDDCSTDNTFEIARSFNDSRVRVLRNDANLGAQDNWNMCLSLAKGEYVKILPGDDTLYPECLAKQAAILNDPKNQHVSFVYCSRDVIDAHGRYVMRARFPGLGRISRSTMIRKNIRHGMNVIGEPGAVLFRMSASKKVGGFDARLPYLIDLNYWVRLLDHGDAYAQHEALCTFRLSGTNWSVALGRMRKENYLTFITMMSKNPANELSKFDVPLGKSRAYLNEILRSIVYLFLRIRNARK
ncbi:Glycosyltransferase involved in cell wall bisynthesis [Desulfonatronum zhilinae]|nr:Glycosyltransferase involved in cell wall bisynthesis [Desulfonatronum zhilinae]